MAEIQKAPWERQLIWIHYELAQSAIFESENADSRAIAYLCDSECMEHMGVWEHYISGGADQ